MTIVVKHKYTQNERNHLNATLVATVGTHGLTTAANQDGVTNVSMHVSINVEKHFCERHSLGTGPKLVACGHDGM